MPPSIRPARQRKAAGAAEFRGRLAGIELEIPGLVRPGGHWLFNNRPTPPGRGDQPGQVAHIDRIGIMRPKIPGPGMPGALLPQYALQG